MSKTLASQGIVFFISISKKFLRHDVRLIDYVPPKFAGEKFNLQASEFEIWRLQLLCQLLSSSVTMHQVLSIEQKSLLQCWKLSICHAPLGCSVNCLQVSPRHFEKPDLQDLEKMGLDQTEHLEFPSHLHHLLSFWWTLGSWLVQRACLAVEADWPLTSERCSCAYVSWRSNMMCNLSRTHEVVHLFHPQRNVLCVLCANLRQARMKMCLCRCTRNFSITRSNSCVRSVSCQKITGPTFRTWNTAVEMR